MTGDQQPADLLDLPFDQYQRYRLAGEILGILGQQALLAEMRRVGREAAMFIGPVHREETALSEELLFDYIQWLLEAKQEQLAEHRGYGLPDFAATQAAFAEAGWATFAMPAGNLWN